MSLYTRLFCSNKDKCQEFFTDPVTGASNFTKFKIDAIDIMKKNPDKKYVFFYSDIKNFKFINDVYGFEVGDRVLKRYSEWLGKWGKLAYARVSADNFVSMEAYQEKSQIVPACFSRLERVCNISDIIKGMSTITVFVGAYCTEGDNDRMSVEAMLDRANIAQRQLKERKETGCILYQESFRSRMLEVQSIENRMEEALENGEFIVYLQPKYNLAANKMMAAEALVRWQDPERGLVSPSHFIPLFEQNGFIRRLDTYMFGQVCRIIRKWIDQNQTPVPISVNVSRVQLTNPHFLSDYIRIKQEYRIPDGLIEIEFTESMLSDNSRRISEVLSEFRENGFLSSIDDFGAGYSCLNLLKTLPTDFLKLDKVFFDDDEYLERERVIIKNVVSMAKELSMVTVAEGVEQLEQVDFLREIGCEMVQGYVFDKPMSVDMFEEKYFE